MRSFINVRVGLDTSGAGYQQQVEVEAPSVDGIYDRARRPDGIGEVGRIGNDQLFGIDQIRRRTTD
jgi:hypothetical protein